ncbi:cohesin subunit SA-1-like isoform X2 [Belonocnema kinseyi]|uniref:cohesin subunit SA-1-like isoform X2 n=1 Tax=Belonocnema kinseyi TaxID=2817044 RepID=UPI00143CCF40|nr:cohesin subunit SA-1-like isoform X2 [Belonocnema kinseyi]
MENYTKKNHGIAGSFFSVMKLTTALVDVVAEIFNDLTGTDREHLDESQRERNEDIDQMRRLVAEMIESVFVHRFKDICPEIRVICMEEMGLWIQKLPQDFLDDNCLKYIGWNLYDSSGEVRLKCLEALQPLYASEDMCPKLENFSVKFKDRIVNMTRDKENEVAVEAVKIMVSILKCHPKLRTDKMDEIIFELVFESYQPLARAAAQYLSKRLMTFDEEGVIEVKTLIQDLVLFYIESEVSGHADLLVDSLMEINEMMKDWECMTDLLLEDSEEQVSENQDKADSVLIELMVCCIKQAATGEIPERRVPKRKMSTKEEQQVKQDREKITKHFVENLPLLLSKYSNDPKKLANLLTIPQYFDLFIYVKLKEEDNLEALLHEMQMIVETVDDSVVLETASKTFECMCVNTEGHPNFARCDLARTRLIDEIVKNYKTAIEEYRTTLEAKKEIDSKLSIKVTQFLKQVALFYTNHDLNHWQLWDSLFKNILDTFLMTDTRNSLSDEAVKYCITSCYFSFLWGQHHLFKWADSDSQSDEKCKVLREHLDDFMVLICSFSGDKMKRPVPDALREDAFIAFCDLLAIFSNRLQSHPEPLMHQLIYTPTPMMHTIIRNFLQKFVFVEKEDDEVDEPSRMEDLAKRRNLLAGYCKLIVYNMISAKEAVFVFKNYVKYKKDYGDLIKETLIKTRDISNKNCALVMQYTLNCLYREIVAEKGKVSTNSTEFHEIKELAIQFSVLFKGDKSRNRDAMIGLHKAGIRFAVSEPRAVELDSKKPPTNLSFLEILSEFTNKLLKNDKLVILNFLNDYIPNRMLSSRDDDWKPLIKYRNSLLQSEKQTPELPGKSKKNKLRKPELSVSKITLPRPSSSGNDSNLEITLIANEDDEVSPPPIIENSSSSSASIPFTGRSSSRGSLSNLFIMETDDIMEE